jgi:uncharacterized protein YwgA
LATDLDKVIASLRFLEFKPNVGTYESRFLIQKTTHLAQALGLQTHYCFTIYVAGPYSPTLAREYYREPNRVNTLQSDYELTLDDIKILEKIKACCDLYQDLNLMECTSTVVYYLKETPNLKDEDIFAVVRSLKPHLNDATCVIGISKAKELLFVPEYLTDELKREMDAWESIED